MNDYQKRRFTQRMLKSMFHTVSDKTIAIWGFAFKKDTNDTRESAAIYVCRDLLEERARIRIYDPKVSEESIRQELLYAMQDEPNRFGGNVKKLIEKNVTVVDSAEEASIGAHAIAVLTEWDEFKLLDFRSIYNRMLKPAFLFDGRNVLDHAELKNVGFDVHAIGKQI